MPAHVSYSLAKVDKKFDTTKQSWKFNTIFSFWIEHKDTDYPKDSQGNYLLSPYVTNIREQETLTGIDFFCNLDDETENNVETLGVENIKGAWGLK